MDTRYQALVITPVKNAIENTMATIEAIASSDIPVWHIVYNDYSDRETTATLEKNQAVFGYELIHLESLTPTPSPNYKTVLQNAQKRALEMDLDLIIVESDVEVQKDTFEKLLAFKNSHPNIAMVGAITIGHDRKVNFPYLKFKEEKEAIIKTNRSLSFCCTLLSVPFMKIFDFLELDSSKDWYDTIISHKAIDLGWDNYVLMDTPVLHKPHGSRPWKQLKYTNPIKYYWQKFIEGRDKI